MSMNALVVYDSFFTNTEQVARAIGEGLGGGVDVKVLRVGDVAPDHLVGLGLLIVGSPTRAFRPTPAVAGFIKKIPGGGLKGVKVAAFDTGLAMDDVGSPILRLLVRLFGYAAKPISDRLRRKGGEVIVPPEGFFVGGTKGPLKEGELERAGAWAERILAAL
jgi:flavodoxin